MPQSCNGRKTVEERIRDPLDADSAGHDLGDDFTDNQINAMSNVELLREISVAIEEILSEADV